MKSCTDEGGMSAFVGRVERKFEMSLALVDDSVVSASSSTVLSDDDRSLCFRRRSCCCRRLVAAGDVYTE